MTVLAMEAHVLVGVQFFQVYHKHHMNMSGQIYATVI
jgi:hypothetical protein